MTAHRRLSLTFASIALVAGTLPLLAQTSIGYRERVTLNVGQSAVVYGYRGECGKAPTKAEIQLPALTTGTLSIGKPGFSDSNRCGGLTPAVEIIFTATKAGRESFELRGDKVTVRVK